jgi:toxin secretion/phage lysis holin
MRHVERHIENHAPFYVTHGGDLVRVGGAAVGGMVAFLFGIGQEAMLALVILTTIDMVAGVAVAATNGEVSAVQMWRGLTRKILLFAVIIVAHFVDVALGTDRPVMATAAVLWFTANEGLSIVEHAATLGVPIPPRLTDALSRVKGD